MHGLDEIQKYSFMWQKLRRKRYLHQQWPDCMHILPEQKPRTSWKTLLKRNKPLQPSRFYSDVFRADIILKPQDRVFSFVQFKILVHSSSTNSTYTLISNLHPFWGNFLALIPQTVSRRANSLSQCWNNSGNSSYTQMSRLGLRKKEALQGQVSIQKHASFSWIHQVLKVHHWCKDCVVSSHHGDSGKLDLHLTNSVRCQWV